MVPSLTEPPLHIAELPPEILLKIFAFLPTQDLLLTVARVSKAFNELVKDAEAHKSVAFTGLVKIDKLSRFLEDKPNIEEFRLIGAPGMQSSPVNLNFPLFINVFSEMKNLRVFEVDDNWDLFPWSLDILSENEHLNRVVANFRQDYFPTIVWQNPKSIKHLEFNGVQNTRNFVDIVGTVEKLERLRSKSSLETSMKMKRIFQRNNETLKEVNLPHYDCSKNDIEALLLCQKLEILNLDISSVPECLKLLTSKLDNLRILKIHSELLKTADFRCKNLKSLSLTCTELLITADFRCFLASCKNLKSLSLTYSDPPFDDFAMGAVAQLKELNDLKLAADLSEFTSADSFLHLFNGCVNLERVTFGRRCEYLGILDIILQDNRELVDLSSLQKTKLKYFNSKCEILTTTTIKTWMRRFPTLRCIIQGERMFVRPDTTVAELEDFIGKQDGVIKLKKVVYM